MIATAFTALSLTAVPVSTVRVDSLVVRSAPTAPTMDGRADNREYGAPSVLIQTAAGETRIWITRHSGYVFIAAATRDSTFYWGDDFVVSLDPDGSGGAAPQPGDRQWYLPLVWR